jgi:hypothetical protein
MRSEMKWTGVHRVHLTQEHEVDSSIEDLKVNQNKLQSRCHGSVTRNVFVLQLNTMLDRPPRLSVRV